MATSSFLRLAPGQPVPRADVPLIAVESWRETLIQQVQNGARLSALFGHPVGSDRVQLYGVLSHRASGMLRVSSCLVGDRYPALTLACPSAHWFERELAEQWGVVPDGNPWLKPIRFHRSYVPGRDAWRRDDQTPILPGVTNYYQMEGPEAHEVAVGPIHAGVIEPGHFRFQCHGEQVFHLEISLGYQHRGIEKALFGGPTKRTIHVMETAAGDTTIGHVTAYCQAYEALAGCVPTLRAQILRGIALELERLANHTGDLGALAQDVGFLPTSSFCGRLRGDFLNATALLCGNRFGRNLLRPGGVRHDLDPARAELLSERLTAALSDVAGAVQLLWKSPSVLARFEETGTVSWLAADEIGLVGPAARAAGVDVDVRHDFPTGIFRFAQIPMSTYHTGDVFARAYVRFLEIQRSVEFIRRQLKDLPDDPLLEPVGSLLPDRFVATLAEGWRGEICHVALTDANGRFAAYKIVDPSFHNWFGLALSLRGQQISDFPLCNKSFNLSYCGHDL